MKRKLLKKLSVFDSLALLLFLLFTLSGTIVSLVRFWQYEIFYYDFGIFDRAIWLVSRFKSPIIDHLVIGGKWIFADHFSPSIFLFSPLFWIIQKSEVLLVAQAVVVGISGLVLYRIGKQVIKDDFLSFSVLISYYLFIGLQNAVISDFHETTVATLFFLLTFYFFLKNKVFYYWLFFIITLGFKESNFVLCAAFSVATYLLDKSWRKTAIFSLVISLIWGYLTIHAIIPYFSGGIYQYSVLLSAKDVNIISVLFDNPMKQNVVFFSLASFSFLPLLSPVFLPLILQDFLVRFLSNRFSLGLHYSALLATILGLSSIYGFYNLRRFTKIARIIAVFSIINTLFLYRMVLHGPLALTYNPAFYKHTKDFRFLNELISKIPNNVSVMTQNNLAPRFTHQQNVWVLKDNYEVYSPKYIVLDMRSGQNLNDFFPTKNPSMILKKLQNDSLYALIHKQGDQYIFKRK